MNYKGSCHCGGIAFEVEGVDFSGLPVRHYDGKSL
jgi:hypothetical protein